MPKLLLKYGAAVIKEIPIEKKTITVGRKSDNDIVLDNQAVSAHHCKISSSGDTFFVEDLATTNGTHVNGKKIIKAGLHHNDVIGIVNHSLVLIDVQADLKEQGGQPAIQSTGKPQSVPHPQTSARGGPASCWYQERAVPGRNGAFAEGGGQSCVRKYPEAAPQSPNLMTGAKTIVGILQVTEGVVDKIEHELTELSTYIGKSNRVTIRIKGAGMFGTAPEVAAMIARRPEGYYIVAIKEGYPALNGVPITKKEPLKDGDVITAGATTLRFSLKSQ